VNQLDLSQHRICVTGGAGFLGRVFCEKLCAAGLPRDQLFVPRRKDYDLTREDDVDRLYETAQPTIVVHLACEVGGIGANRAHPGRFFFANLAMGLHLIEHARKRQIAKFVQVGTVCAYPRLAPVPFKEEDLWNGYPEETNAPYAIAKKSLFVMLDAYQQEYGLKSSVVVPVNLYGPGDNFDLQSSHVIPALIRKIEEAQKRGDDKIVCWGSGSASREFLFVDDAAAGIVQATLKIDSPEPINLGTGREIAIRDLVQLIAKICEFDGNIEWDATKPDGQPRRCLDITRAKERLHWQPEMQLEEGLRRTISWWRNQVSSGKFQESGV
jgi:GDP-L-fucose synthase